jgi:hypothetical protein
MLYKKFILILSFTFFFSVLNVFQFHFFVQFKAVGDLDVSKAFGTTRNFQTGPDEVDNSNSSTGSIPETISPIADAGTDITVQSNILTQLDGSKSYDPSNSGNNIRSLDLDWTQTSGPDVILNNLTSTNPTFTSPEVEEKTLLTYQLKVRNDAATRYSDSVTVSVPPDTEPDTPDTEPDTHDTPDTEPDTQEFQTVVKNCDPGPTETFREGSLTIITDQDFSQVYKITPNPYTKDKSLYFVNNDFFECDSKNSVLLLNELDYS